MNNLEIYKGEEFLLKNEFDRLIKKAYIEEPLVLAGGSSLLALSVSAIQSASKDKPFHECLGALNYAAPLLSVGVSTIPKIINLASYKKNLEALRLISKEASVNAYNARKICEGLSSMYVDGFVSEMDLYRVYYDQFYDEDRLEFLNSRRDALREGMKRALENIKTIEEQLFKLNEEQGEEEPVGATNTAMPVFAPVEKVSTTKGSKKSSLAEDLKNQREAHADLDEEFKAINKELEQLKRDGHSKLTEEKVLTNYAKSIANRRAMISFDEVFVQEFSQIMKMTDMIIEILETEDKKNILRSSVLMVMIKSLKERMAIAELWLSDYQMEAEDAMKDLTSREARMRNRGVDMSLSSAHFSESFKTYEEYKLILEEEEHIKFLHDMKAGAKKDFEDGLEKNDPKTFAWRYVCERTADKLFSPVFGDFNEEDAQRLLELLSPYGDIVIINAQTPLDTINLAYRGLAKKEHSDAGGDGELLSEVSDLVRKFRNYKKANDDLRVNG